MATLSGICKHQRLLSSVSLFAFTAMWAETSLANPTGGSVVAGQATISASDTSTLVVNQASNKAIINWDNFDIDAGETTRFQQPGSSSVALNRDFSGDPSRIMGSLEANGRVFLINRSGILFGRNSRVDTAGLVASTHDITDENFLGGNYVFDQQGEAGASVVNLGNVTIADQGLAAFVGPSVRNDGAIVARLGTVELASANGFTLDFNGDEQLTLFVENPVDQVGYTIDGERIENLVENQGRIEADGGLVVLSAVAARGVVNDVINHDGVIQANSVGVRNGKIILSGGDEGVVRVSGTVSATGGDRGETGGHIEITGDKVGLFDGADVDASGHSGGGTALVGGDYQGRGDTPTAEFTYVAANARVSADAQETGDGGRAIVWADDTTRGYGTVTATGGAQAGDGGFIEVSGKASLDIAGLNVSASASNGAAGEVLFDPGSIRIVGFGPTRNIGSVFVAETDTLLRSSDIVRVLNNGTNVTIQTQEEGDPFSGPIELGHINIESDIIKTSENDAVLNIYAGNVIVLHEGVTIGQDIRRFGLLDVNLDADFDRLGYGLVDLREGSIIQTNGGSVNFNGHLIQENGIIDLNGYTNISAGDVRRAHDYSLHIADQFFDNLRENRNIADVFQTTGEETVNFFGKQLTETEDKLIKKLWVQKGLIAVNKMRTMANDAFSVSEDYFPLPANYGSLSEAERQYIQNDGHIDAFRHAYWNALMVRQFGKEWTESYAVAHEKVIGNPPLREAMDLYNNSIGRNIAVNNPRASDKEIADLIFKAVQDGDLVVVHKDQRLVKSDEIKVGEHGSVDNFDNSFNPEGDLEPNTNISATSGI